MRYTDQKFQFEYIKTIGTNFFRKHISLHETEMSLLLWDLAGDESFGLLRPVFYQGALGAFLVFDISQRTSFASLENWLKELQDNLPQKIPTVLACNKIDIEKEAWTVSEHEIQEFANAHGLPFFMTSAKSNKNVEHAFLTLAKEIGTSLKNSPSTFFNK